jgi:hypothetical protein
MSDKTRHRAFFNHLVLLHIVKGMTIRNRCLKLLHICVSPRYLNILIGFRILFIFITRRRHPHYVADKVIRIIVDNEYALTSGQTLCNKIFLHELPIRRVRIRRQSQQRT